MNHKWGDFDDLELVKGNTCMMLYRFFGLNYLGSRVWGLEKSCGDKKMKPHSKSSIFFLR